MTKDELICISSSDEEEDDEEKRLDSDDSNKIILKRKDHQQVKVDQQSNLLRVGDEVVVAGSYVCIFNITPVLKILTFSRIFLQMQLLRSYIINRVK